MSNLELLGACVLTVLCFGFAIFSILDIFIKWIKKDSKFVYIITGHLSLSVLMALILVNSPARFGWYPQKDGTQPPGVPTFIGYNIFLNGTLGFQVSCFV